MAYVNISSGVRCRCFDLDSQVTAPRPASRPESHSGKLNSKVESGCDVTQVNSAARISDIIAKTEFSCAAMRDGKSEGSLNWKKNESQRKCHDGGALKRRSLLF